MGVFTWVPLRSVHIAWLRAENARNCDIYFRPFRRQAWPVVFLDDLPPRIALKIGGKYRAAVIETSTGRCHLWLVTTRSLDEDERTVVQRDLVARLQGAADPGSVSGDHWGRLPGFRNHKPGRDCWVNLLALTKANPYSPSLDPPISTPTRPKAHHPPCKPIAKPDGDGVDMSRLEWGWVCGCLESGLPSSWVLDQLIERARARRGDKDAIRYARHTVAKACRILGHSPC